MWICDETGWLNTVTQEYIDYENYYFVARILNKINFDIPYSDDKETIVDIEDDIRTRLFRDNYYNSHKEEIEALGLLPNGGTYYDPIELAGYDDDL